jgi:hypothetical protein
VNGFAMAVPHAVAAIGSVKFGGKHSAQRDFVKLGPTAFTHAWWWGTCVRTIRVRRPFDSLTGCGKTPERLLFPEFSAADAS